MIGQVVLEGQQRMQRQLRAVFGQGAGAALLFGYRPACGFRCRLVRCRAGRRAGRRARGDA